MSEVVVVDYDPDWPAVFEALRVPISRALGPIAISIEHVGSTAVPGLVAKPVIDIDVVVAEHDVSAAISRLASLGYMHRGDCGVPDREAFRAPADRPSHHLYVCPSTSRALANHLAVRDYLRGNPSAARAYGALKKQLALQFPRDSEGYGEAKTSFLVAVLRNIGFPESELEEISRINRRSGARDGLQDFPNPRQ